MPQNLYSSFFLVDASGLFIIAAIVVLLLAAITTTLVVRHRYSSMARELSRSPEEAGVFRNGVLNRVVGETLAARRTPGQELNTQAIIENALQSDLGGLLMGERFVKASTGLLIILGLVGTFYGLTQSIGELVALVSSDFVDTTEVAQSLTAGLTKALSGMSVAFTTSLVGIAAAIVMTLVGVFANVADRRTALMVRLESYLDNLLTIGARGTAGVGSGGGGGSFALDPAAHLSGFAQSVAKLESSVIRFETALTHFADSSRDFKEFNHHLKDNVQRLSVCFADLSDGLQQQVSALTKATSGETTGRR